MKQIQNMWRWFFTKPMVFKIAVVTIVLSIVGWMMIHTKNSRDTSTQYQTATVDKGTLVVSISASGTVQAANSSDITTAASGVVTRVFTKNGDRVRRGEAMAVIELDQTAQQKYVAALSSYQSAKNSLESTKAGLWTAQSKAFSVNQKFINDAVARDLDTDDPTYIQENADWLAAEASYKIQEQAINQSQTALNSSWLSLQNISPTIYAPISGKITGMSLQEGQVIAGGEIRIASIKTDALPTILVSLTEIDVPKVKIGNKSTITLDAYPDKTYTGSVVSVDTVGEKSSGVTSYTTAIRLDTKEEEVYSNMSAQATILINSKTETLIIPSGAVQSQNGVTYAKVLKNGKMELVEVELGLFSDTEYEVVSGLNEGDTVITGIVATAKTGNQSSTSPFGMFGGAGSRSSGQVRGVMMAR